MLVNIIIIILGVGYLLYLSTFDYAHLPAVVSQHGELASSVVAMFLTMFGFSVLLTVLSMILNRRIESKQKAFLSVATALVVNASCLATIKPATEYIKSEYKTVGEFVAVMKMAGDHNKGRHQPMPVTRSSSGDGK